MIYEKAKGVFYSDSSPKLITQSHVEEVVRLARDNHYNLCRICYHDNEESQLMLMLIAVLNKFIYPPHRHQWKDESYHILRGKCVYKQFIDSDTVSAEFELTTGQTFLNTDRSYHSLYPLTDELVFLETAVGPFMPNQLDFF